MTAALVGAASCARCGADLGQSAALCPSCGTVLLPAASGDVVGTSTPLLAGVARASAVRRYLALAGDVLPLVVAAVIAAVLASREAYGWLALLIVGVIGYLAVQLALMVHRGRSIGRLLTGLRTVDDLTGNPVTMAKLITGIGSSRWPPGTVTAVLGRGRDPLAPAPAGLLATDLAESAPEAAVFAPVAKARQSRPTTSDTINLVFDTGRRHLMWGTLLIGRSPENSRGLNPRDPRFPAVHHPLLALPDLSRTLSKTHALLEWSGSVLWVTDLHSANGSVLISPEGDKRPLVPGIRGAAAPGWTVQCGARSFTVHATTAEAPQSTPIAAAATPKEGEVSP